MLMKLTPTIYEQLLCAQIPKAQNYSHVVSLFCTFGIFRRKRCALNVGEIDTWSREREDKEKRFGASNFFFKAISFFLVF